MNQAQLNSTELYPGDQGRRICDLVHGNLAGQGSLNVIAFVDKLLKLVPELGNVCCTLRDDRALVFKSRDQLLCEVEIPRCRTMLRVVCARLSVVAGEQCGRQLSPYGDEAEFPYLLDTNKRLHFKLRFQNTPDRQEFEIL